MFSLNREHVQWNWDKIAFKGPWKNYIRSNVFLLIILKSKWSNLNKVVYILVILYWYSVKQLSYSACGKVLWVYMVLCQTFIHAVSHCKFHSLLLIECTWINVYENIAALGLYDRLRVFCCCSCQSTLIGFNKWCI